MKRTLKKLFKKDKRNVMLVFVFIIGLSVMLYPPISSYWNSKVQSRAVASYSNAVKSLTEEEKEILTDACKIFVIKGQDVHLVEGEVFNIKITYPYDLRVAETLIKGEEK